MKITYLKLKNYSNIYTAFKSNEISIDFKNSKNTIILLTGPNGSGKTSILSCLHPFATNGNLDIRNDNPLVLKGKEGYKEIHLNDDGNEYIIKHFYTPSKDTHTTKSYIMRNGMELNVNGNVTSFKEIIKDELEIEIDYLKLTRLGSNVTNFIDLKTTERKSFMGKILDELDIYLKYHKKITSDMREVKSIISHLVDKINKLDIDEKSITKYQKDLKKKIEKTRINLDSLKDKLSIINNEINNHDPLLVVKENADKYYKKLEKMYKILKDSNISTVEECDNILKELELKSVEYNNKFLSLVDLNKNIINSIDRLIHEEEEIRNELEKYENNDELNSVEYMIKQYKKSIENRCNKFHFADYKSSYTKEELNTVIVELKRNMDYLYSIYEFGKEPIKKAIEYIITNDNITDYVESTTKKRNKNKLQNACEYVYKHFGDIKPNDRKNCKAQDIYDDITDLALSIEDETIEDETFVTSTKLAYQGIKNVLDNFNNISNIIDKMPKNIKDFFLANNMFNNIENLKCIYNQEILYSELSIITEYEIYKDELDKYNLLKEKKNLLKKSLGNTDYFLSRLDTIKNELISLTDKKDNICDKIEKINLNIKNNNNLILEIGGTRESLEQKETIENEFNNLNDLFNELTRKNSLKKELENEFNSVNFIYEKMVNEYNLNDYNLSTYKSLKKEFDEYSEKYDEMELIKNSLSSKEGIPLLYIQIYLKNIQDITNELLDVIYDGDLFIDDFNITADEFKIPFTTKDTEIKDVCYASQGERSFISLALSFALIYQSISRYNIMLLDEIDSTLDTKNREKFLQILEKQLSMIDGEQIFVISHNNMFNMYPVDIIDTKNIIDNDNTLSNQILIEVK